MERFNIYDLSMRIAGGSKSTIASYVDILSCLNYRQVCKDESYKKHSNQYVLSYTIYFGHTATTSFFYLFSKKKADLICSLMKTMTEKCQSYITTEIEASNYPADVKAQLLNYTKSVGYKVNSIKEAIGWEKAYKIKRVDPRSVRIHEHNLRENACSRCGGGGCPACEPSFFC